jgi:hypothetical protein
MKSCPQCGAADLPDAARFCPACGAAAPASAGAASSTVVHLGNIGSGAQVAIGGGNQLSGGGRAAARDEGRPTARILFVAANPRDTTALKLREEARTIRAYVGEGGSMGRVQIEDEFAVTRMDLSGALHRYRPQVLHFAGHGLAGGAIVLEDEVGGTQALEAEVLADLLGNFKSHLRCVVLNACWSAGHAEAIARHIDTVVGMTRPVQDEAAVRFAAGFYQTLGYGGSPMVGPTLSASARDMMPKAGPVAGQGAEPPDEALPQLMAREGVDPAELVLIPRNTE